MPTTPATVPSVIADCQTFFPDFDAVSCLTELNNVNNELQFLARIMPVTPTVQNVTANQQSYAFDSGIERIWQVVWQDADSSGNISVNQVLRPTNLDELDQGLLMYQQQGGLFYDWWNGTVFLGMAEGLCPWRAVPPNNPPFFWFLDGTNFSLFPAPSVSTGSSYAGYPCVQIYSGGSIAQLTNPGNMPALPFTTDVWKYGACARWAWRYHRDQAPAFQQLADRAKAVVQAYVNTREARKNPRISYRYARVRTW